LPKSAYLLGDALYLAITAVFLLAVGFYAYRKKPDASSLNLPTPWGVIFFAYAKSDIPRSGEEWGSPKEGKKKGIKK